MSEPRRFPTPWTVEESNGACFIIKDANGIALTYVYYYEGARLSAVPGALNKDEARRLAKWFARSPNLAPNGPV